MVVIQGNKVLPMFTLESLNLSVEELWSMAYIEITKFSAWHDF